MVKEELAGRPGPGHSSSAGEEGSVRTQSKCQSALRASKQGAQVSRLFLRVRHYLNIKGSRVQVVQVERQSIAGTKVRSKVDNHSCFFKSAKSTCIYNIGGNGMAEGSGRLPCNRKVAGSIPRPGITPSPRAAGRLKVYTSNYQGVYLRLLFLHSFQSTCLRFMSEHTRVDDKRQISSVFSRLKSTVRRKKT